MRTFLIALALALTAGGASAKVRPSAMISDNMVLQQNASARKIGRASCRERVCLYV